MSHIMKQKGFDRTNPQCSAAAKIDKSQRNTDEENFKCIVCDYKTNEKDSLTKHKKLKHEPDNVIPAKSIDEEFNCKECDFQSNEKTILTNHINLKHTVKQDESTGKNCYICDAKFSTHYDLMNHRKEKHIDRINQCRNFLSGTCRFTSIKCWWKHEEMPQKKQEEVACKFCDKTFSSKRDLMNHRKQLHLSKCRPCVNYGKGICLYEDQKCWYQHENIVEVEKEIVMTCKYGLNCDNLVNFPSCPYEHMENPVFQKEKETQIGL